MICDLVAERSQGRFIIEHYPAGILGGEFDTFDQLMVGAIELMIVGPAALGRYYEPINILQAHYVFRDLDHMFTVMRGPIGDDLYQSALDATGVPPLMSALRTRHLTRTFLSTSRRTWWAEKSGAWIFPSVTTSKQWGRRQYRWRIRAVHGPADGGG